MPTIHFLYFLHFWDVCFFFYFYFIYIYYTCRSLTRVGLKHWFKRILPISEHLSEHLYEHLPTFANTFTDTTQGATAGFASP